MRRPLFSERREGLGGRHLAQTVSQLEAGAHAEIIHREDVRPAETKHQHHLHGPASDSPHLRQPFDDLRVRQRYQGIVFRNCPVDGFARQIFESRDFSEGQAGGAQCLVFRLQDFLRCRESTGLAAALNEATQDGSGCRPIELLMGDGLGESLEWRANGVGEHPARSHCADQGVHDRVDAGQVRNGRGVGRVSRRDRGIRARQVRHRGFSHFWHVWQ